MIFKLTKNRILTTFFVALVIYAIYSHDKTKLIISARLDGKSNMPPVHQKILVLMTQTRSGSTFTGEIFAATNNSMYLYEPLFPYGLECHLPSEKVALLTKLLNCDFHNLRDTYSQAFKQSGWGSDVATCMATGFCFTFKSPGFLDNYQKACSNTTTHFDEKSRDCGYPLREDILSKVCTSSTLLLTKVNRICTLEEMDEAYSRLKSAGKDVYVLHMLRDVRSIASSVIKIAGRDKIRSVVQGMVDVRCPRQRHNVLHKDKAFKEYAMIADGRYMKIRHEDLTTDAINVAKRVFKFMGKPLPREVVSNIVNRLHPNQSVLEKIRTEGKAGQEMQKLSNEYKNPYGVVRDPIKVLNEWRNLVPFEEVVEIQKKCGDVLEELGYVMFSSEEQMKDLSIAAFRKNPEL